MMKKALLLFALCLAGLAGCKNETAQPEQVVYLSVEESRGEYKPVLATSSQLYLVPEQYTVIYTAADGRQVYETYPSQDALQFSKYIRVKPGFVGSVRIMDAANTTAKITVRINDKLVSQATGVVSYTAVESVD